MYCTKCGKQISDDSQYCTFCGAKNAPPSSKGNERLAYILAMVICVLLWLFAAVRLFSGRVFAAALWGLLGYIFWGSAKQLKEKCRQLPKASEASLPLQDEPDTPLPAVSAVSSAKEVPATSVRKTYRIAGVTHYEDAFLELAIENGDYDLSKRELIDSGLTNQRVWKYDFVPSHIDLLPEPENPHDPNAIKVVVDGSHIGYIKAGSCAHLRKVMSEDRILRIDCEMGGGPYKYVSEEYDEEKDKDLYTLERDKTNFYAVLEIEEAVK